MKNVIITGGSGLLALNWAFVKKKDAQITLLLHQRKVSIEGVDSMFINLRSEKTVFEFLSKVQNCIVIHCAAITDVNYCEKNPEVAYETNSLIAGNLANICSKLAIKFVHISSDHLFSGLKPFSSEELPLCPQNVYGSSKADAEKRVLQFNPDSLVIRTNFFCWGPTYRASFSDFLINSIREKKKISLYTDIFYTPIYATHLVELVHKLVSSNLSGIFNVVGSERLSKYEFGKMVFSIFSGNMKLIKKTKYQDQANSIKRPLDMSLSNKKLIDSLNVKIVDLENQVLQLKADENDFKKASNYLQV